MVHLGCLRKVAAGGNTYWRDYHRHTITIGRDHYNRERSFTSRVQLTFNPSPLPFSLVPIPFSLPLSLPISISPRPYRFLVAYFAKVSSHWWICRHEKVRWKNWIAFTWGLSVVLCPLHSPKNETYNENWVKGWGTVLLPIHSCLSLGLVRNWLSDYNSCWFWNKDTRLWCKHALMFIQLPNIQFFYLK